MAHSLPVFPKFEILQSVIHSVKTNRWDRNLITKAKAFSHVSVFAKLDQGLTALDTNNLEEPIMLWI